MTQSLTFIRHLRLTAVLLLGDLLVLSTIYPVLADNLGQSDWITPTQQSEPSGQSWQAPTANEVQTAQEDLNWQAPASNGTQALPQGQNWQTPSQPANLGQSSWQQPQQAAAASSSQLGQSGWQQPAPGTQEQTYTKDFYNNYPNTQTNSVDLGQQNGSYQYQQPGAYLNGSNQTANTLTSNNNQNNANGSQVKGHVHKDHQGLKDAVNGLGKAVGIGLGVSAPLAGAYLMGRAMSPYGMPMAMPMGMGMNPYLMGGYGMPYGGMPMNGLSSFMHY